MQQRSSESAAPPPSGYACVVTGERGHKRLRRAHRVNASIVNPLLTLPSKRATDPFRASVCHLMTAPSSQYSMV
jgi:hypothetical protein